MGSSIRFTRPCATCGRNIQIPIAHIGREVACGHCGVRFVASIADSAASSVDAQNLEERIDRLLAVGPMSSDRFRSLQPTTHTPNLGTSYEV
jgi:hypothetical protein